jgi:hypothetical protein
MSDNKINKPSVARKGFPGDLLTVLEQEFDSKYYIERYPDVREAGIDPLEHYAFAGWLLARDPCHAFSTSYYLSRNKDVVAERMNPFYHYLKFGRSEGRWPIVPSAESIEKNRLKAILRVFFDADFYLQKYPDIGKAGLDPLEHYVTSGFSEGMIPFPGFEPKDYQAEHGLSEDDSPLYHYVIFGRFAHERRAECVTPGSEKETGKAQKTNGIIAAIKTDFDAEYYLNANQDIALAGLEPVRHYVEYGWKAGANPHPEFDTHYYLDANPDVKASGCNPFWHYLVAGRAENRVGVPEEGYKKVTLRSLKSIDERVRCWSKYRSLPEEINTAEQILAGFNEALIAGSRGLVVSVGHDDYQKVIGGVQLCIAEEQELLNAKSINYLNISPASPMPVVSSNSLDCLAVKLILNGAAVGVVYFDVFLAALEQLVALNEWKKYLLIHAMHGHKVEGVIALNKVLSPEASYYWMHDYFSICPGSHLVRNDVDYCHAPDSSSPGCAICIYGEIRNEHLSAYERLFREIGFEVISPSRFTLDLWKEKSSLPYKDSRVIAHRELLPVDCRDSDRVVRLDRPLRVAYLGYPATHKGWPIFKELVDKFGSDSRYVFYHIGIGYQHNRNITFIEAKSTWENLELMAEIVQENEIDIVVLSSISPETFSLMTYEAVSAGCFVLTGMNSGNIAALVQERDFGMVYESEHELHDWFESGSIIDRARGYQSESACYELARSGITAPLILEKIGI